jgi:hypothetical protein
MDYYLIAPTSNRDNFVYAFPENFSKEKLVKTWRIAGELSVPSDMKLVTLARESGEVHGRYEKGLPIDLTDSFPQRSDEELAAFQETASREGFSFDRWTLQGARQVDIAFYRNTSSSELFGINPLMLASLQRNTNLQLTESLRQKPLGLIKNVPFSSFRWLERDVYGSVHDKAQMPPAIVFPTESKFNHFLGIGQYDRKE